MYWGTDNEPIRRIFTSQWTHAIPSDQMTRMPESTIRCMTKKPFKRWTVEQMILIGKAMGKYAVTVMWEVEKLSEEMEP